MVPLQPVFTFPRGRIARDNLASDTGKQKQLSLVNSGGCSGIRALPCAGPEAAGDRPESAPRAPLSVNPVITGGTGGLGPQTSGARPAAVGQLPPGQVPLQCVPRLETARLCLRIGS